MKKRADGRYQLSIMIGFKDDGTPKRKLVYGKTQKDVKKKRMISGCSIVWVSNWTTK
jgi:hypothetical protein